MLERNGYKIDLEDVAKHLNILYMVYIENKILKN